MPVRIVTLLHDEGTAMTNLVGLVALCAFVTLFLIAAIAMWLCDNKLDDLRSQMTKESVLYNARLFGKIRGGLGVGGSWRLQMGSFGVSLHESWIHLILSAAVGLHLSDRDFIIPISNTRIHVGEAGFPIYWMRECIVLESEQLGQHIRIALHSKDVNEAKRIWDVLVRLGVKVDPEYDNQRYDRPHL